MPIKVSLVKSTLGYTHMRPKPKAYQSYVNTNVYPSVEVIVTKEFDVENDNDESFDDILIVDIDIVVNGNRLYYERKVNKPEPKWNISIENIIDKYESSTGNKLNHPFEFNVIVKDNFGTETPSTIIMLP